MNTIVRVVISITTLSYFVINAIHTFKYFLVVFGLKWCNFKWPCFASLFTYCVHKASCACFASSVFSFPLMKLIKPVGFTASSCCFLALV